MPAILPYRRLQSFSLQRFLPFFFNAYLLQAIIAREIAESRVVNKKCRAFVFKSSTNMLTDLPNDLGQAVASLHIFSRVDAVEFT